MGDIIGEGVYWKLFLAWTKLLVKGGPHYWLEGLGKPLGLEGLGEGLKLVLKGLLGRRFI